MQIKKILLIPLCLAFFMAISARSVQAMEISRLGVHILHLSELFDAKKLVSLEKSNVLGVNISDLDINADNSDQNTPNFIPEYENWSYVTIPLTFDDLSADKELEWQEFFDNARRIKVIPIVRLATRYDDNQKAWIVPNRKQIIEQIEFLSRLNWPTDQRHIIVFNEVNHIAEWGGYTDPVEYATILKFVSNWAHTEGKNFVILPAAMDLAAPNGYTTLEAFNYLSQMYNYDPEIFSYVDIWNSHSYPNPGFISSPYRYGKNTLRGYQYELDFLKNKTGNDFEVMITETGWKETPWNASLLTSYYIYAMQYIWSDERVLAVTPFLLRGDPGPFSGFSFIDSNNQPTNQFHAFEAALKAVFDVDDSNV